VDAGADVSNVIHHRFWTIYDRHEHAVVQRVIYLTEEQREILTQKGYQVERTTLDRDVWQWLVEEDKE
jgi:hypothetical protein